MKSYPTEAGRIDINGHRMEWAMKRSKSESAFGIQGSRIFDLTLKKDGVIVGEYEHGWSKIIPKEDEESNLCIKHLLRTYGRNKVEKVKK